MIVYQHDYNKCQQFQTIAAAWTCSNVFSSWQQLTEQWAQRELTGRIDQNTLLNSPTEDAEWVELSLPLTEERQAGHEFFQGQFE